MLINEVDKNVVRCNALLTKRYRGWLFQNIRKDSGLYYVAITFMAAVCIMIVTVNVLIERDNRTQFYSSDFFLLFGVLMSMLFGSRLIAKTTVQIWHLLPYPMSNPAKYRLLLIVNMRDYRTMLYAAVTLTFTVLFFPQGLWKGVTVLLTCILFSISTEIWLLNIQLAISALPDQKAKLLEALYYLPFPIYVFISHGYNRLLMKVPLTGWASGAISCVRTGDWGGYTLYLCLLALTAISGLLTGNYTIHRRTIRTTAINEVYSHE